MGGGVKAKRPLLHRAANEHYNDTLFTKVLDYADELKQRTAQAYRKIPKPRHFSKRTNFGFQCLRIHSRAMFQDPSRS